LLSSFVDGSKYRIIENNVKGKGRKNLKFLQNKFFVRFWRWFGRFSVAFGTFLATFHAFLFTCYAFPFASHIIFFLISSSLVWTTFTI